MLTRRRFIQSSAAGAVLPNLFGRVTLAAGAGDARFILVILRGALDGLSAVPAWGDPHYRSRRGSLALPEPGAENGILPLDDLFGLHPVLKGFHTLYQEQELLIAHAVATPYRERSHFDGQKLLENGTTDPLGADDGWLNRALKHLPGRKSGPRAAVALAQTVPLVLYGAESVSSWAPSVFPELDPLTVDRLAALYKPDPFFSEQFEGALATREMAADIEFKKTPGIGSPGHMKLFPIMVRAAANFLADPAGPRIAVLETAGWDTHDGQGAESGYLANQLQALDEGIQLLKTELRQTWSDTVVIMASEFGRTVAVNGTGGTDHGTGSAVFLAGGAVQGGRVLADWPGLSISRLHMGRDLNPTLDMRTLFKGILHDHLRLPRVTLDDSVFPGSRRIAPAQGVTLTKAS